MAQVDRAIGLRAGAAIKNPCKAATTANIALSGEQTIDGVACVSGDRVLVKEQTDGKTNGIYEVDTGTWSRTRDFDGNNDVVRGTLVPVYNGSGTYALYAVQNSSVVIGTTSIVFETIGSDSIALQALLANTADADLGASLVGIHDAAGNFTAADVEGALAEILSDLADAASASLGDALVGVKHTGIGAVARTAHNKFLQDLRSADDFGTLQQAVTDAETFSQGAPVYLPAKSTDRVLTSTLNLATSKKNSLLGDGRRHTVLDWQGTNTSSVIYQAGTASTPDVAFKRFEIKSSTGATGLTGIQLGESGAGASDAILMVSIDEVLFNGLAKGVEGFDQIDEVNISRCWFFDSAAGVLLNAVGGNSFGNWNLWGNQFQGITGDAFNLEAGSRFLLIGNTVQGTGASMSGFIFDAFDSVAIISNYWESHAAAATGPFVHLGVTALGAANMSGAIVDGNHIDCGTATAGQIGIKVDFAKGVRIGPNAFTAIDLGIEITANAENVLIEPQAWGDNVTTKLSDLGTDTVILDPDIGIELPHLGVGEGHGTFTFDVASGGVVGTGYANFGLDVVISPADVGGANAANHVLTVEKVNATGRSINAAGTVNASGADYAEYETKSDGCGVIEKGQIVGFDADGKITDRWSEALSFGIKSTDPSYVGGDSWGSEETLGIEKPLPPKPLPKNPKPRHVREYNARLREYKEALKPFNEALEAARQKVDRVAYSGKVPVNVTGAKVGDYVVAEQYESGIMGVAVTLPTFEQYRRAVGRVRGILPDGRAHVAIIVH